MGTLWIKEGDNITMRRVRTGLTDGSYTQVMGRRLEEGEEVVVGMENATAETTQQRSPFAPQFGRRR